MKTARDGWFCIECNTGMMEKVVIEGHFANVELITCETCLELDQEVEAWSQEYPTPEVDDDAE